MTFIATKLFHKAGEGSGGGGDRHNLGWYATESALTTAHPTANDGDWAIVGSTDTVWVWDSDTTAWKDTDTKGQVTSVNGQTGAVTVDGLPSQTGNSGKFLTTDGTDASWSDKPLVNNATGGSALAILSTNATGFGSIAIGDGAVATGSQAVAYGQYTAARGDKSIAIRGVVNNFCRDGISIGGIVGAEGAIQIGDATNNETNTMKVRLGSGNYKVFDSDGTIPTDRLTKVNSTITLAAADWSAGTQTVTVNGITATSVVWVSPDPSDQADYVAGGILCTAQAANSLTFTASTTPTNDIDVVVVAM